MKAKSILLTAWVLMISVAFANASGEHKFSVYQGMKPGIFKVVFEGKDRVQAMINVLDKEGNVVFSQHIKGQNGFILPMNFIGLKSGEYVIEAKKGNNRWTQTVNYIAPQSAIQQVFVSRKDGKYVLSISKTGSQTVSIGILDSNDELIHEETRKADGSLAVVYDVKNVSGEVKFRVTDTNGYSKVIKM